MMEEGTEGCHIKRLDDSLRKFRMDKKEALKGQSTLLRHFRCDFRKPTAKSNVIKKRVREASHNKLSTQGSSDPAEEPPGTIKESSLKSFRYGAPVPFPSVSGNIIPKSSDGEDKTTENQMQIDFDPYNSNFIFGSNSLGIDQTVSNILWIKAESHKENMKFETEDQSMRNPLQVNNQPICYGSFEPVEVKEEEIDNEKWDDESGNSHMPEELSEKSLTSTTTSPALFTESTGWNQNIHDCSHQTQRMKTTERVEVTIAEEHRCYRSMESRQRFGDCQSVKNVERKRRQNRERQQRFRARQSVENAAKRRRIERERILRKIANETPEQTEKRRRLDAERHARRRANRINIETQSTVVDNNTFYEAVIEQHNCGSVYLSI